MIVIATLLPTRWLAGSGWLRAERALRSDQRRPGAKAGRPLAPCTQNEAAVETCWSDRETGVEFGQRPPMAHDRTRVIKRHIPTPISLTRLIHASKTDRRSQPTHAIMGNFTTTLKLSNNSRMRATVVTNFCNPRSESCAVVWKRRSPNAVMRPCHVLLTHHAPTQWPPCLWPALRL